MSVFRGESDVFEIVERDDGFISVSPWPARYFSEYSSWPEPEQQAMRYVKGRVLDVGCGAGRHGLYLQKKGFDVKGIDSSPGAVKVCKLRGYENARLLSISQIHKFKSGSFDTVIMMGNNFGLFGSFVKAKRLLQEMYRVTSPEARIIAEATDPYWTKDPIHRGYHRLNRRRGRMGGQLRIRLRHKKIVGQWFDYLLVSQKEMKIILTETGWRIKQILSDTEPGYSVQIIKTSP